MNPDPHNAALLALVVPQIDREESCRLTAYLDSKGIWTIGWGRADSGVTEGMTCTQAEADGWRDEHILSDIAELDAYAPWWRGLTLPRQAVLVEMVYQLGIAGTMAFHDMIAACQREDWDAAASAMLDSKWARTDSPARAHREAGQMRSGIVT
jgi:lysozyme